MDLGLIKSFADNIIIIFIRKGFPMMQVRKVEPRRHSIIDWIKKNNQRFLVIKNKYYEYFNQEELLTLHDALSDLLNHFDYRVSESRATFSLSCVGTKYIDKSDEEVSDSVLEHLTGYGLACKVFVSEDL